MEQNHLRVLWQKLHDTYILDESELQLIKDKMRCVRKWKATNATSSQSVSGLGNWALGRSTA